MIVSVSRRCDIPRFQFDWFMEKLNAGFTDVANPYNAGQIKCVSLAPEDVDAFVFWTRNPRHILANADELTQRGFPFYVMVSVTGYPVALEPNMTPASEVLLSMKELSQLLQRSKKMGQERVIWRYDPVILTSITDEDFHRRNFNDIAQKLAGSVKRVIISIYDDYQGAKKRLEKLEKAGQLRMINTKDADNGKGIHGLLSDFAKSAEAAGMEIQSCAEKEDFSLFGIKPGACIDAALIEKMRSAFRGASGDAPCNEVPRTRDKNQRPNCLCCKSVDIGAYNTCPARCVYCYAS